MNQIFVEIPWGWGEEVPSKKALPHIHSLLGFAALAAQAQEHLSPDITLTGEKTEIISENHYEVLLYLNQNPLRVIIEDRTDRLYVRIYRLIENARSCLQTHGLDADKLFKIGFGTLFTLEYAVVDGFMREPGWTTNDKAPENGPGILSETVTEGSSPAK